MHTYRSLLRRSLALLLAALLCAALGGCRESPVLQEVLYESAQEEADPDQEELDPEDQGEEDEQLENQEREDADTQRQEAANQGLTGQEDDASQAAGVDYSATSGHPWDAADPSGDDAAQNGAGSAPSADPDLSLLPDGADASPENTADASLSTAKQVVDGAGRTVTLPENVDTVTAVGWAAQAVEMLGGSGRLAGADSAFLSSALAGAAFSDLGGVQALWTGDGSTPLSDRAFTALLSLAPDVCFEVSGDNTFTDAQVARLEEAGVAYVVLPALTSTANLNTALDLLAQILDSNRATGESAASLAGTYSSWVSATVSAVKSKTSGMALTSLYIAGWDPDAQYVLNNTHGVDFPTGLGLAYAYSPRKAQFLTPFMAAANITNESTRIASLYRDTDYLYVTPMFQQFKPTVSGALAAYYDSTGRTAASKELFVSRSLGGDSYCELGDAAFPAVIAADQSVKAQLESNFYWQAHDLTDTGYYTAQGMTFYHGVAGAFSIYVLPQGMCDWAQGSLESPLLTYWLACQFDGVYTLDQVKDETRSFYQTFFGAALTDQQLRQIFGE
jgi:ABC-type Fe3+-hydroxamate transport system substrate-binding protein